MPIKHAIWKVGPKPTALDVITLATEQQLEEMIVAAPEILSGEWLLIGRQEQTSYGGRVDLLALTPDASLVLIEIKRNRTPREIVAQALDYASWVAGLTADKIAQIYRRFSGDGDLGEAFRQRFGTELDEDTLNESHQIVLVAAELDDATERIITYLNDRDIAINVLYFQVFQCNNEQLLSRAWLIDPGETQVNVAVTAKPSGEKKEPWNGEYYVSYSADRNWDEARRFGFIRAGGGRWYSQTLKQLEPGDRIWVKIPGAGFVGVGTVTEAVQSVQSFTIKTPTGDKPVLEVLADAEKLRAAAADPEKSEYFVRVEWLDTVPQERAFNEVGLFGLQHIVCRPTTPKWRQTVERLKSVFVNWNGNPSQMAAPTANP